MERYTNPDCKPEMEELMKDCPRSRSEAECWLRLCDIEDILGDEYDLEKLKELVQAKREGRCVVLPCKLHDEMGRFKKQEPEIIKVKRVTESAVIPQRQSIGAAGFDLCADIAEDVEILPHGFSMIYSGIAFEIPHNYFGAIYARSGLATRQGLRPATCVSVIDSDYRGNVGLPMFNDSNSVRVIHPKERIAQIVFQKALMVDLVQVDSLSDSERGDNGFGSTGR